MQFIRTKNDSQSWKSFQNISSYFEKHHRQTMILSQLFFDFLCQKIPHGFNFNLRNHILSKC